MAAQEDSSVEVLIQTKPDSDREPPRRTNTATGFADDDVEDIGESLVAMTPSQLKDVLLIIERQVS